MWVRRTAWFVTIWAGSVLTLGAVAMLMRALMGLAGLTG